MARKKKLPKTKVKTPRPRRAGGISRWWSSLDDARKSTLRRSAAWTIVVLVILFAGAMEMKSLERRVLTDAQTSPVRAVRVRLIGKPDWMPDSLVRKIAADIAPRRGEFRLADATKRVYTRALRNPWIANVVRIEKRTTKDPSVGLIEVRATYRSAVARILQDGRYFYVSADGVRLPTNEVPKWIVKTARGKTLYFTDLAHVPPRLSPRRIQYVMIDGVRKAAPPEGKAWKSDALGTAMRLVKLIRSRPYAAEFSCVDVRNAAGLIPHEPHLRLYAQRGNGRVTEIRFGRFPDPDGDHVISPQRKMSYLDQYVSRHGGRLAGFNSYLDLRYDSLHVSLD